MSVKQVVSSGLPSYYTVAYNFTYSKGFDNLKNDLESKTAQTWGEKDLSYYGRCMTCYSKEMGTVRVFHNLVVDIRLTLPTTDRATWLKTVNVFLDKMKEVGAGDFKEIESNY